MGPELCAETDEVGYGSETPDMLPQRELHLLLKIAHNVLQRSQKHSLVNRNLVETNVSRQGLHLRLDGTASLSHFQPAVRFFQFCMTRLWLGLEPCSRPGIPEA